MSEVATRNGSELAIGAEQSSFTRIQVEALRKMNGWENVPDAELTVFFHQSQRTGLDPFARQIYLIGRNNRRAGRTDYTIQTGIDGLRLIADRTGRYAGSDAPTFGEDDYGLFAKVTVHKIVGEQRCPFTAIAYDREYRQERSPMWSRMPRGQLGKCCEALALRKAFPADLSGIYTHEEMDQAGPPASGAGEVVEGEIVDSSAGSASGADPGASGGHGAQVGDILKSQVARIEKLSYELWGNPRAVEEKVLRGITIEEITADQAAKCIAGITKALEKKGSTQEGADRGEADENPADKDEGWAPLLTALADELYDDKEALLHGHEWLQRELGKPLVDLDDDEAEGLYERLKTAMQEGGGDERMTEDMIGSMKRYKLAKEHLEEQTETGRQYLESVKADVEQDLEPLRRQVEAARSSMEAFLREENGGEKFKVPGLGTAYFSRTRKTTVTDQEAFIHAYDERTDGASGSFYEPKLVPSRVKQAAEGYLQEYGELLPGVESEEVETLSVRLSTTKAPS